MLTVGVVVLACVILVMTWRQGDDIQRSRELKRRTKWLIHRDDV